MSRCVFCGGRNPQYSNENRMDKKPVKLSELIEALEFDSPEHVSKIDLQTGRLVMVDGAVMRAMEEGDEEALSDMADKEDSEIARAMVSDSGERFVDPPDKFEFHEYRQMERFIGTIENSKDAEQLLRAIKGNGAFRYFKDTAHRLGLLEQWYEYRDSAMKEFARDWAAGNEIQVEDDMPWNGKS
jgi:Uncharacterised protein family (UPF0158)